LIITPFNPHLIIGIIIGLATLIFPLHIATIPIYARVSVAALREVDHSLVEATLTMGWSIWQIIVKDLIPKSLPGLVLGAALTIISLIKHSAITVAIDGGQPWRACNPLWYPKIRNHHQDGYFWGDSHILGSMCIIFGLHTGALDFKIIPSQHQR